MEKSKKLKSAAYGEVYEAHTFLFEAIALDWTFFIPFWIVIELHENLVDLFLRCPKWMMNFFHNSSLSESCKYSFCSSFCCFNSFSVPIQNLFDLDQHFLLETVAQKFRKLFHQQKSQLGFRMCSYFPLFRTFLRDWSDSRVDRTRIDWSLFFVSGINRNGGELAKITKAPCELLLIWW